MRLRFAMIPMLVVLPLAAQVSYDTVIERGNLSFTLHRAASPAWPGLREQPVSELHLQIKTKDTATAAFRVWVRYSLRGRTWTTFTLAPRAKGPFGSFAAIALDAAAVPLSIKIDELHIAASEQYSEVADGDQ